MQCPVCTNVALKMTDRQGVEIDYCPNCRGVWLDRGELDKIIERAAGLPGEGGRPAPMAPRRDADPYYRDPRDRDRDHDDDDDDRYRPYGKHRKKRGFLGELFDFD